MFINEYGDKNDPLVLLLAPMMVSGEDLYQLMHPYFKYNYHYIAPDQGGHGKAGAYVSADEEYKTLKSFLLDEGYIQGMKDTAALRAADRNPYSWNMEYLPYPDGSGYEARFTTCGICTLMKELGLFDLVPAMCRLDYTMSEAGGASEFVREYTLASGGPHCDCGYKKKRG